MTEKVKKLENEQTEYLKNVNFTQKILDEAIVDIENDDQI